MDKNAKPGRLGFVALPLREVNWWLLLLIPLSVLVSVAAIRFYGIRLQNDLEPVAPYMVALAAAVYAARSLYTRNPLYILLTALMVSLTLREIHFDLIHRGIYVLLAVIGIWGVLWRKRLAAPLTDWRHTSWLIVTLAAYFVSQLIAKRAFRGIPGEHEIHRSLEECVETAAHLMLIVTSLVGNWRTSRRAT